MSNLSDSIPNNHSCISECMVPVKLIRMSTVEIEQIRWIWEPYIPAGKLTIVQGDPGEGKTSFVLAVAAALTTGKVLPDCEEEVEPVNVIFQTAEDGLGDTIKPRLVAVGADCTRITVIDESEQDLSLCDDRIEAAIMKENAKMMVIDPLQAYLGSGVDMHRANEVRPVLKKLAGVAEHTGCAIVLIGHMNKAQGMKASYRGLGSIDLRAAARSVLAVGRLKSNGQIRVVAQDKNSLAPEGKAIVFELDAERGFSWKGYCDATVDDVLNGAGAVQTKTMFMEELLREKLLDWQLAEDIQKIASDNNISERTLKIAKRNIGVVSKKMGTRWYWKLPDQECKDANA